MAETDYGLNEKRGLPQPIVDGSPPQLNQVLGRYRLPPVDLFSFYIYMRDQQQAIDYLDFWLDVEQHTKLCRYFVGGLRLSRLIPTPDPNEPQSEETELRAQDVQFLKSNPAHLPGDASSDGRRLSRQSDSSASNRDVEQSSPALGVDNEKQPVLADDGEDQRRHTDLTRNDDQNSENNDVVVTRQDVFASAEKILYTFLLEGSEREICLPEDIRSNIEHLIVEQGQDHSEVFEKAQTYVYQAIEADAFPGFIRTRAMGNLIPTTVMLYSIIGLISIFASFWTAFVLIFLNHSRANRCWVIFPFIIAVYFLTASQFRTDPIMALLGKCEYKFQDWHQVKDQYVQREMGKRRNKVLGMMVLVTVLLCLLFILVPGKRL